MENLSERSVRVEYFRLLKDVWDNLVEDEKEWLKFWCRIVEGVPTAKLEDTNNTLLQILQQSRMLSTENVGLIKEFLTCVNPRDLAKKISTYERKYCMSQRTMCAIQLFNGKVLYRAVPTTTCTVNADNLKQRVAKIDYFLVLKSIVDELFEEDKMWLKFWFSVVEDMPGRVLESNDVRIWLRKLEQRGKMSQDDLSKIKGALGDVERQDLVKTIESYEGHRLSKAETESDEAHGGYGANQLNSSCKLAVSLPLDYCSM